MLKTQSAVSPATKQILKAVAGGPREQDELKLQGGRKRAFNAARAGKLLRERIERVTVVELTTAGRRVLEGDAAGKPRAASHGHGRHVGAAGNPRRGRRPDPHSARARAEPIIASFKGERKDLIALLVKRLKVTPDSASTMIYNAGKT